MAADRNVTVTVRADVADFLRGAGLVEAATKRIGDQTKRTGDDAKKGMSGLAQAARDNREAWTTVGGALTTYGAAVTGIGAAALAVGINYNTLRQRSVAALTTMTGSAEAANAQMDKLDEFASNSPFARDVFIRAQQQLIGFRREAETVIPTLDAIQNAVAATGGSNQDIEELVRIIAQVGAAGKITAEDLNQFGQRGVDAATLIGSQMGLTGQQIREEITAGTLDADAAIAALVTGMDQRFGGAAAGVKETMDGAVDRVKAAFRDIGASFASVLVDPTGGGLLVDGLNSLADAMRWFEDLPGPIQATVAALAGVSGVASLAAGGFLILAPRLVETWDALGKMGSVGPRAQGALRGIGNAVLPGGTLIVGLGLLGAGLGAIRDATTNSVPGLEGFTRALLDMESAAGVGAINDMLADLNFQVNGLSGMADGPIDDFGGALRRMLDPSLIQQAEQLDKVISFGQMRTSKDDILDFFNGLDGALSGLVQKGHATQAATQFERLVAAAAAEGYSREELLGLFPQYSEALIGLENDATLAADAVEDLNGQFVKVDPSILQGKYDDLMAANRDLAGSFSGITDGLADEEVSLNQYLDNMIADLEARDKAFENAAVLIGQGFDAGLVRALLAEDGGAMRLQQMVDQMADDPGLKDKFNTAGQMGGEEYTSALAEALTDAEMPEVKINADLMHAAEQKAELESIFLADPATMTVDADASPAEDRTLELVLWAADQTGIVGLDADDHDAIQKVDLWNALANNTVGLPTLDADPAKAATQLAGWLHDANTTLGVSTLNANKGPADAATFAWERTANSTSGTASLGANASSAYATLYAFARAAANTSVNIGLGATTRRAAGGPVFGPGTATSDSIPAMLSNGEHVMTAAEVAAAGGHGAVMALRKSLLAAPRYATGGPVSRAPATAVAAASSTITAVLAAEDRALLRAVADRPVALSIGARQSAQIVSDGSHANRKFGGRS